MNPVTEECSYLIDTTTHVDYHDKSKGFQRAKPIIRPQTDPLLINGQKENHLLVNNKPIPYKVSPCHPYVKNNHEEYANYIKRLPCSNKNIYCKYFVKPSPPEPEMIPDLMMENKTVYQKDYSPDEYVSKNEKLELGRKFTTLQCKQEFTTYADSYNRLFEMKDLRNISKVIPICEEKRKRKIKEELQKIYKTGLTIYHTEICQPAILRMEKLKSKNLLRVGPLDPYTLRKL